MRSMDDAELDAIIEQARVFARVDPEHKLRIVRALQRKGHIVAMTGDGINDAPALKTANIGVAMGITGTDVSKEAAHIILTDDNYASIVKAIEEGRGVFDNIQKYLIYLLSTNSGELMTMFAGVMFAGVLGLASAESGLFLPLLAAQLLWINLITDGPPALALGIEPKDREAMERRPRRSGSGMLLTEDWIRLGCVGALMMLGTLAVLDAYYPGGLFTLFAQGTGVNAADEAHARTMAFTTLMMFQLFDVYNCRSRRRSAFSGFFENKWLLVAIAFSLSAHVLVIYVPFLQMAFHTVPLSMTDWLIATGVSSNSAHRDGTRQNRATRQASGPICGARQGCCRCARGRQEAFTPERYLPAREKRTGPSFDQGQMETARERGKATRPVRASERK